jgi:hypothetical protein
MCFLALQSCDTNILNITNCILILLRHSHLSLFLLKAHCFRGLINTISLYDIGAKAQNSCDYLVFEQGRRLFRVRTSDIEKTLPVDYYRINELN